MAALSPTKHDIANAIPVMNGQMREILFTPDRNMSTMYQRIWAVQAILLVPAADYFAIDGMGLRTSRKFLKKIIFWIDKVNK